MKKNLLVLLALFAAVFAAVPARAADYTVEPNPAIKSNTLPLFINSASVMGSLTQQIFLAEELLDDDDNQASAGDITALTFYYAVKEGKTSAPALTRSIEIWLMQIDNSIDAYTYDNTSAYGSLYKAKFLFGAGNKAGTKVFDGDLETKAIGIADGKQSVKLDISAFSWDGTSNIVMTVLDKSTGAIGSDVYSNLRFYITETTPGRFVHWRWLSGASDDRSTWIADLDKYGDTYSSSTSTAEGQANSHKYVALTTFSISPISAPSIPTGLAASNAGTTSITLSWNDASSAAAYDLQWSSDGENWNNLASGISGTSHEWTGRTAGTSYFVRVRATNAVGESDWSAPVSVATEAVHEHNGITFNKWAAANALPTEGSFFLNNDVTFGWVPDVTLTGDLNLCLNGKTANLGMSGIIVPSGKTLTIFDDSEGGTGKITSFFPGQEGISFAGVITVQSGGTLILGEGSIENTFIFDPDDPDYKSIAIASAGTFKLSGAPAISGNNMDIFLAGANVITIESGKPLTNASPWTISRNLSGAITSGWANMGGANPADFFSSVSASAPAVVLADGEAKLLSALALADSENNDSKISDGENQNTPLVIVLTRSFVSSQFNTICLPFSLSDAQLQAVFGAGYDLEEFVSSSFDGETIDLAFTKVNALVVGKPYLIKPAADVANPVFNNVTIPLGLEHPADQTDDDFISFHGVFSPTELQANNKNLLFLGANNELFWPSVTNNILGFRAYFEVKGSAKKAVRARIVQKDNAATAIDNVQRDDVQCTKVLRNGQLHLLRNGEVYNVQGQRIK